MQIIYKEFCTHHAADGAADVDVGAVAKPKRK